MRYIGNKTKLVDWIYETGLKSGIKEEMSIFDCFAGTGIVGEYFKSKGHKVFSSDLMHYSFVLQKARIEISKPLDFKYFKQTQRTSKEEHDILKVISEYFDSLSLTDQGFIFNNYCPTKSSLSGVKRMYFTDIVGQKLDSIRIEIERLHTMSYLTEDEYYYLIACLINTSSFYSNTAGVYGAFHKSWDPRALKPFVMRFLPIVNSSHQNKAYLGDSVALVSEVECDVLYMDPPYNSRQYAPNYHVLETISRYDNPDIKGVSGMRDYSNQKSDFSIKKNVSKAMEDIVSLTNAKIILLSYNDEGLLSGEETLDILSKYGKVKVEYKEHLRYKSKTTNQSQRKNVKEKLFILIKE